MITENSRPGDRVVPVLFIQGAGEGTYEEWDDKLVASLRTRLGPRHDIRYPRMPNEDDPDFNAWSDAVEREILSMEKGAVLVGHSVGGTILIRMLASRVALLERVAGVFLVAAPYVGDGGWPSADIIDSPDWAAALTNIPVFIYWGDADEITPRGHVELYAKAIPHARLRHLCGRDHQLGNDLSEVAEDILGLDKMGQSR